MTVAALVRHGATERNESARFQGRSDLPLSPRGLEQARLLEVSLSNRRFSAVWSSPLRRAQETARALGFEPELLEDLREIDRGEWEGRTAQEIRARWPDLFRRWYEDPTGLSMPGGESYASLRLRADRVASRLRSLEGDVLLCAHKAINRVLIARLLQLPDRGVWAIPQPQACLSLLRREKDRFVAERVGDVGHLPEDLRSSD